jgi:hypothetical protein
MNTYKEATKLKELEGSTVDSPKTAHDKSAAVITIKTTDEKFNQVPK